MPKLGLCHCLHLLAPCFSLGFPLFGTSSAGISVPLGRLNVTGNLGQSNLSWLIESSPGNCATRNWGLDAMFVILMMCLSTLHSALASESSVMLHIKQLTLGQALWIIKIAAYLWSRKNQMLHLPPDIITHHSHYLTFSVLVIPPGNKAIFILWNANVISQKHNIHLSVFINTLSQILFYNQ